MSTWIHDEHGVPRLRMIYDGRIMDIEDNLMGWVSMRSGAVYNAGLEHIGWFRAGILRDTEGYVVGFTQGASDPDIPGLPDTMVPPAIETTPRGEEPPEFPPPSESEPPEPLALWSGISLDKFF